jgi:hypothetical protein
VEHGVGEGFNHQVACRVGATEKFAFDRVTVGADGNRAWA